MKQNAFLKRIFLKNHSNIDSKSDSRLHSMFYNMPYFPDLVHAFQYKVAGFYRNYKLDWHVRDSLGWVSCLL